MSKIFLSYRRGDSADVAGRLGDRLRGRFGRRSLFMDIDSIPVGSNFKEVLAERLQQCRVLIAVIGEHWFGTHNGGGTTLDDPDDFVAQELRGALSRRIPVVPVLVGDAQFPSSKSLPHDLRPLRDQQALRLGAGPDFSAQVDRLMNDIAPHMKARRRWGRPLAVLVLVLFASVALIDIVHPRWETVWSSVADDGSPLVEVFGYRGPNRHEKPAEIVTQHWRLSNPKAQIVRVEGYFASPREPHLLPFDRDMIEVDKNDSTVRWREDPDRKGITSVRQHGSYPTNYEFKLYYEVPRQDRRYWFSPF